MRSEAQFFRNDEPDHKYEISFSIKREREKETIIHKSKPAISISFCPVIKYIYMFFFFHLSSGFSLRTHAFFTVVVKD